MCVLHQQLSNSPGKLVELQLPARVSGDREQSKAFMQELESASGNNLYHSIILGSLPKMQRSYSKSGAGSFLGGNHI